MGNIENIHIAVCDDEELTHREVEEKLIEYRESRKCVYKLSHYDSAQMLQKREKHHYCKIKETLYIEFLFI